MALDVVSRQDALRDYRVQLRRAIERQKQLISWRSGDAIDNQRRLEALQIQLRSTEREWAEIEAMLGRPRPLPPVKYGPVKISAPVKISTPARSRTPGPYLNRMISSR
jgi:hypothetical protein